MAIDPNTLKRVQKLLALAQDSRGNENEAASAMARAQEILAEHNLSLASVVGASSEKRERTEIDGLAHGNGRGAMYNYQRQLMRSIAEANFCTHWIITTGERYDYNNGRKIPGVKSHMLIGRESNVVACRVMFEYLNEAIERTVPYKGSLRLSRSAISWKEGCANRLMVRIDKRRRELELAQRAKADAPKPQDQQPGTTVTIYLEDVHKKESDLNNDALNGWEPGTTERKRAEADARHKAWVKEWEARQEVEENQPKLAPKPETEAQRRKREQRERNYEQRQKDRYAREVAKKDWNAYNAGGDAGSSINLDQQIDESVRPMISTGKRT